MTCPLRRRHRYDNADQPIYDCFMSLCDELGKRPHLIYMSPQGQDPDPGEGRASCRVSIMLRCCGGHYEGVDQRVIDEIVDEEISIGDYSSSLAASCPRWILADAISRMLPGVLANEDAFTLESHYGSLLEYPAVYTAV